MNIKAVDEKNVEFNLKKDSFPFILVYFLTEYF